MTAAFNARVEGLALSAVPVAFDGLAGWFSPGLGRRGVVLCGARGFEGLAAYRAWRGLAEAVAATGCATLRFDWPGEGDSGDAGAASLEAWVDAVRDAARFLRAEAGVAEVVLVGLRLGGTVAALAAGRLGVEGLGAEKSGVDRLVLLAPFAAGRAYLREQAIQARAVGRLPDGSPLPRADGDLTVGGFPLDPGFAAELEAVDLAKAGAAPAPRILLLGAPAALAARYRALGAAVEAAPFPGLTALLANPLFSRAPAEAFRAALAFAVEGARPGPDPRRPAPPPARLAGPGWREEPAGFGERTLAGTLCRPETPPAAAARRPVVLFVNAGTNRRSGWGRGTTNLARALAGDGVASLRVDLGGVGDSPDRADGASPLYSLDPLADVAAAIDHLAGLPLEGLGPVVLVGACSGAYLAFNALCRDPRVRGALLVNLYRFDWRADDTLERVLRGGVRDAATYAGLLRRRETWRRALKGEIRVAAIAAALLRRLAGRLGRVFVGAGAGGSVAARVAAFRARGGVLRMVYSVGDAGLAELHEHLGASRARVARRLGAPVQLIPDADHDLSPPEAQGRLAAALRALVAEVERAR